MIVLRCSALPLFMKCAQSVRAPLPISEHFDAATMGTAAHDAAARYVRGIPVDMQAVANLYGVDVAELSILAGAIRKAWQELQPPITDVRVAEQHLGSFFDDRAEKDLAPFTTMQLTGTADVLIHHKNPEAVTIIDWKTGRRDSDYREQVIGYCALALDLFPGAELALAKLAWVRNNEVEAYSLTRADFASWKARLLAQGQDDTFRPGAHCQYCPRKHSCPAREEMQRSALATLKSDRTRVLRELPADEQVSLYRKAREIGFLASQVLDEIKDLVTERGGLEGGGVRLSIVEEERRTLRPMAAWPVLQKYLSDEGLANSVTVHITKAEDIVARAATEAEGRGAGKAKREAMVAELEAAGAITRTTMKKLTERRSTSTGGNPNA